ncbi:MAG: OmpA family protein [Cytophagales bacterium]
MKTKLSSLFFAFAMILNWNASATDGQLNINNSNYVVIGAFSIPKNAIEFTEEVRKHNLSAEYSINPVRNLFYVYVLHTGDRQVAFEEAKKLRKKSPYSDTWVYTGLLGENQEKGNDVNPMTDEKIVRIEAKDQATAPFASQPAATLTLVASHTSSPEENPINTEVHEVVKAPEEVKTPSAKADQIEEVELGGKKMLFKIVAYASGSNVQGDVDIVDLDKAKPKKIASYRGNEAVKVRSANKSGNVAFECEVFGYRKISTKANFNDLAATEGVQVQGETVTVPFELVRLKQGDYQVMYNVYFYNDAGIMRPESKYEINSLLDMMRENPKYKIRIHGHTNGNSYGKIISMGESQNFFAITTDVKNGFGSAKKLSEERAKVVRQYLIKEGIDPTRLQVKAWGGKRPLYDEDHARSHSNLRVEIEIIAD